MSIKTKSALLFALFSMLPALSMAQKVIKGSVQSANNGLVLPGANIYVKNTYLGTVTNRDGIYSLSIPDSLLPVRVRVSYIGYQSSERTIRKGSSRHQAFKLKSSVHQMEKLVVRDEDPGMRIMRRVIKHKERWQKKLRSYKATAYGRQNLSSDTTMVMITEEASRVFWSKEKGIREIIKWHHQTANIQGFQGFEAVNSMPNFYDDNTKIGGYKLVGITNPKAFKYYKFKLMGRLSRDEQTVYHIKVIPKRELQPLFKGSVYVLGKKYALLKVNLTPNEVVRFPTPIKNFELSYQQKFNNFGGPFWLPVDVRMAGSVKISMIGLHFPVMKFNQLISITDYKINVPLPDSLYSSDDIDNVETLHIPRDSVDEVLSVKPIPLSSREKHAYAEIDSGQTLEKVFKPTGFLARLIDFTTETGEDNDNNQSSEDTGENDKSEEANSDNGGFHIPGHIRPLARYNRVDGLFARLKYSKDIWNGLSLTARGGYSTAAKLGSYGAGIKYRKYFNRFRLKADAGYQVHNSTLYHSQIVTPTLVSIPNLLGSENYFDYFREKAWSFSAGFSDPQTNLSLTIGFKTADQTSLQTNTGYDILRNTHIARVNPAINNGRLNALSFSLGYNRGKDYTFGILGRKRIVFNMKISDQALGSDFDFRSYSLHADWNFTTFLKRRLFPNTLNISLDAGTSSGRLPLQEIGIVDVSPTIVSPFGALRAARFRPYEGSSYITLNAEHDFGTVPFELAGLNFLVKNNIGLIVFGGAAKTWFPRERTQQIFQRTGYRVHTTDGVHVEAGLSLTGIFDLFRIDFAKRIDKPVFLVGISLTRFR